MSSFFLGIICTLVLVGVNNGVRAILKKQYSDPDTLAKLDYVPFYALFLYLSQLRKER